MIVIDPWTDSNVDLRDWLTGHHGFFVLGKEANELASRACLHFIEGLHDLDEADGVVLPDRIPVRLVNWFVGRRLAVENAGQG